MLQLYNLQKEAVYCEELFPPIIILLSLTHVLTGPVG